MTSRVSFWMVVICLGVTLAAQTPPPQAPQTPPPAFRGGTTLVPVDVRVLDRNGKPVTDLTQNDFTVLENGARQQIRHFSTQTFDDLLRTAPRGDGVGAARAAGPAPGVVPAQDHRVFLILLGRGRLQVPGRGVDGVIHFVRDRLLPQDQVAVLAWNRATDFTTDHASVLQILNRFKGLHEDIENKLKMRFSGLAAMYGGTRIPDGIQRDIDMVFGGTRAEHVRTVTPGLSVNAERMARDVRDNTDLLLGTASGDLIGQALADQIGMSLDEYVEANAQTSQDLGNMYLGIEYLRHLDGEKHLVFVSETGLKLPRGEDDRDLAAAATDARVVIDYIHTGGTMFSAGPGVAEARTPARGRMGPPPALSAFPMMTARTIAQLTGGQFYANQLRNAADDLDYIDRATRFEYVLGYYPADSRLDGKYRRIAVQVNRPGLTVLYRHGYFASAEIAPFNRERILTYGRVASAAGFGDEIHDLRLQASATLPPGGGTNREISVTATLDISRVKFTRNGPLNSAAVELAAFALDGKDNPVGHIWKTVTLTFSDDRYQEFLRSGVPVTVQVPVTATPKNLKLVAYNYAADIVGSVLIKIQ
jgi:VWFA-related protein